MKLVGITINNYRCIEEIPFPITEVDGSHTYALIGVNESGKSSFLKAISLIDDENEEEKVLYPKDFFDENQPINISLTYRIEASDYKKLHQKLLENGFDKNLISEIKIKEITIIVSYSADANVTRKVFDRIIFEKKIFKGYSLQDGKPTKIDSSQDNFDIEKYFEEKMPKYFWQNAHRIVFWRSDEKHLINEPIDLDKLAEDPEKISIPLMNCFNLAKIYDDEIPSTIKKIKQDPSEMHNLQEKLRENVTTHIRKIWPDHPVKIAFQINNNFLSFLIEDDKVKHKSKTIDQRSDGFRQFISFLLTISAENETDQLSNTLLLLDEPETHLHPQAQEYLREELIKITKNDENNICIFATHSNYMIDKEHINRCYRVLKPTKGKTQLKNIEREKSTYSEVNYEVFNIPSTDYHNELYGYLQINLPTKLKNLPIAKKWHNEKTGKIEDASLSEYIRHSIHHPENTKNNKFTLEELVESLKTMRKIKYKNEP